MFHVELLGEDYPLCQSCSKSETRDITIVETLGHNVLHTLPVNKTQLLNVLFGHEARHQFMQKPIRRPRGGRGVCMLLARVDFASDERLACFAKYPLLAKATLNRILANLHARGKLIDVFRKVMIQKWWPRLKAVCHL
jgi:hypothetical protein